MISQFGKMRNLSLIMDENNNNQFLNYIKNDPMLNDYNYNNNNQNTLYQSYDNIPYNNHNNINTLQNNYYENKNLESNSPTKRDYSGKKLNRFYNFIDDGRDKQKIENNNNINTLGETGYYFEDNKIPKINEKRKNIQNNYISINNIEDQRHYYSNNNENNEKTKLNNLYETNEVGNKPNKYYLRNNSADPWKTYMDSNKKKQNYKNMRRENIENSLNFVNEYMESGKK